LQIIKGEKMNDNKIHNAMVEICLITMTLCIVVDLGNTLYQQKKLKALTIKAELEMKKVQESLNEALEDEFNKYLNN